MRPVLRGIAGLIGLLGGLVGVPFGFMALGQGPPTGLPEWHQLVTGIQRPITDSTVMRAAGLLCWLVWAAFAIAVVIEVIGELMASTRRHRRSIRLRVPGVQRIARSLVLMAALLLPHRGLPAIPVASSAHTAIMQYAAFGLPANAGGAPETAPNELDDDARIVRAAHPATVLPEPEPDAVRSAPNHPTGRVRYVVQRYDSPWSIAERHLGDGTRWRDIVDADGHRLDEAPPAGRSRSHRATGRIIHPGEVLLLPSAHSNSARSNGSHAARPAIPHTGLASPGPPARRSSPTPTHSAPQAAPPSRPGTVAPPALLTPAGAVTPAPPTIEALPAAPGPSFAPPTVMKVASHQRSNPAFGALLEAGLVGASVIGIVGLLRQRQAQRRPPGRRIRLPGPEVARAELALRAGETPDRAMLVARAAELLAETLIRSGVTPPTVLGVVVDDDGLEILLDRPAPAQAPWTSSAEGFRWRIGVDGLRPALGDSSAPLPALTSVGRAAASNADVLINLEAAGLVGIAGHPVRAAGLIDAMATHLAGAAWAGAVDLVLVGLASSLSLVDRVRIAPSIPALRDELRATANVMTETMAGQRCVDPFTGRVAGLAGDGWPPVVVFCAYRPGVQDLAWLSEVAKPGSGVAAVVAGAGDTARWVIDVDVSPMPINPLRLAVEPTVLSAAHMGDIGALLEVADNESGADLTDPPYDRIDLSVETVQDATADPDPSSGADDHGRVGTGHDNGRVGTRTEGGHHAAERAGEQHEPTLAERLARVTPPPQRNRDHADPGPAVPDSDILVRVLGTIEVDGAREFKRAKARELVVYLAMHPNGVGEAELDEALWPSSAGRVVSPSTRDSTVSVARTAIGGPARLLPAQGQGREKRYQLGGEVGSDWRRFCILHRWGREHHSTAALHQALETVRGRPFEGVVSGRTYGWIHMEGHARHIEAEVADAADLAAGLFLDQGDAAGARWAARRGLVADPYTERLWVRLMEAAHHLGESQEVERIMDEMDVILELGGDFSGLHPITLAAYDRISRRHRFPSGK